MKKVNKPNILFLCVDQWPGKLLGCAGHTEIETPTIDRLAASGIHFTRAWYVRSHELAGFIHVLRASIWA